MSNATQDYILTDTDIVMTDGTPQYVLRVRDMASQDKPREKMLSAGVRELTLIELVAVMWGVGTRKEEVMAMAHRVVHEYGERATLDETNPQKIADVLDIPLQKACQLVASMEIGRRYYARRAGKPVYIRTAEQAYQFLKDMAASRKEQLRGLYLNSRYEVVHDEVISIGSLTANIVHPREVFQPAIEHGAVAVIIAHNHPSGNPDPTLADTEVTSQLRSAGMILGIELLDHVIVTADTYVSLVGETV